MKEESFGLDKKFSLDTSISSIKQLINQVKGDLKKKTALNKMIKTQ